MEDHCNPFSWDFFYQVEGMEDQLRHSLLYTTLELETTIASAKEKISRRDEEVVHLKDLLSRVVRERDEAKAKCQGLVLEKLMLQQQLKKQQEQEVFAPPNHEDESKGSDSSRHYFAAASSDSDENIISSPDEAEPVMSQDVLAQLLGEQKALPEKGKLLQAVIDAGPLLQTLLLAGTLPQWQHPPPQLKSTEIPPVTISPPTHLLQHQDSCISTSSNTSFGSKRGLLVHSDGSGSNSDSSPKTKNQKIVLYRPS